MLSICTKCVLDRSLLFQTHYFQKWCKYKMALLNRSVGLLSGRLGARASGTSRMTFSSGTPLRGWTGTSGGSSTLWSWLAGRQWLNDTVVLLRDAVYQLDYIAAQRWAFRSRVCRVSILIRLWMDARHLEKWTGTLGITSSLNKFDCSFYAIFFFTLYRKIFMFLATPVYFLLKID